VAEPVSADPAPATEVVSEAGAPALGWRLLRRLAAALHYRDFRILWLGAFTSTCGTWIQKVGQSWLVLTLTGSAFFLGLDAFLGELPLLLLTLIGGVIADRHDRRRLLMGSQYVQMTAALVLAALTYWDLVRIWHVLGLSFLAGCAQAFGGPAYQSLIPSLVHKDHLPNAVALNSIQFNLARAVGPWLAGLVLAALAFGNHAASSPPRSALAALFALNALSFTAVIVALRALRVPHAAPAGRLRLLEELGGGLQYVRRQRALVSLVVLVFVTTFLSMPLQVFLPVFAQQVFGRGATVYTRLVTCFGVGAVAGALVVAYLGRFRHMGLALLLIEIVFGGLLVAFAVSRILAVSYALLVAGGMALLISMSLMTSLVQLIAPNELRGRVMSIYMMALRGGMPLGGLVCGYLASLSSAPAVLVANGVLLALIATYFAARSRDLRSL
jgi:predicted MFS family arabinose efflux permease